MKKILLFCLILFCNALPGLAQESPESTIDEKFTELINSSNNYKGYKVVDREELSTLQTLTSNRIAELKAEIAEAKNTADMHKQQIASLEAELKELEIRLGEVTAEKDAIEFLGMPFSKAGYKTMMWSIVGILLIALAIFVFKFKQSHVHTREARKNLAETEKEFEAYRAKSLEKEQRLGRLLQDEKNKHLKISK